MKVELSELVAGCYYWVRQKEHMFIGEAIADGDVMKMQFIGSEIMVYASQLQPCEFHLVQLPLPMVGK